MLRDGSETRNDVVENLSCYGRCRQPDRKRNWKKRKKTLEFGEQLQSGVRSRTSFDSRTLREDAGRINAEEDVFVWARISNETYLG